MNHDRFLIKKTLGKGGFGVTYLAYDNILKKDVALKIIILTDGNSKNSALGEIDTLKFLSNFPACNKYIVCYYDSFIENNGFGDILFLVSEYINGTILQDYITGNLFMSSTVLLSIIYGLVNGLMYIHEKGYAHGDIKPDNIIITADGNVKYIDFGLACTQNCISPDCNNSCSVLRVMSAIYTSPDYYRSDTRNVQIAQSNDVWSLGLVLYQLANIAALPFDYSSDRDTLRANILSAPKYKSHNNFQPINSYIDSFLTTSYLNRPNIQMQYSVITDIIHNNENISTSSDSPTISSSAFIGQYISP